MCILFENKFFYHKIFGNFLQVFKNDTQVFITNSALASRNKQQRLSFSNDLFHSPPNGIELEKIKANQTYPQQHL